MVLLAASIRLILFFYDVADRMKAAVERVQGEIIEGNGRYALLLIDSDGKTETAASVYLRCAFVTQGVERLIFPAFILDDWGGEIKGPALYDWFDEFAAQFPRAEVFGFDESGQKRQRFLRELEQYDRWPCFAFSTLDEPLMNGRLIEAVLLADEAIISPQKIKRPPWIKRPLRQARVSWWRVNPRSDLSSILSPDR